MSRKTGKRPRERTEDDACAAECATEPGINLDESPLSWLARRKDKDGRPMLSEHEIAAGERLRADFWFAKMTPNVTANWSQLLSEVSGRRGAPDHGAGAASHVIAARERVRLALKAAGPDLAGMLIDVCCHLNGLEMAEKSGGWPSRSGKVVLQIALRLLARHYGFVGADGGAHSSGAGPTHWGADGYRPKAGGGEG